MTKKIIILSCSVLFVAAGLGYIFMGGQRAAQNATPSTTAPPEATLIVNGKVIPPKGETAPAQDAASLSKQFEVALNRLLIDVQTKARLYRAQRAELFDLMRPEALGTVADMNAHYQDVQRRAALLRTTIDDILLSFENANAHVEELLYQNVEDEDTRQALLESWQNMKEEQVSSYLDFFDIEEQIITAQLNLMAIYDAYAKDVIYNAALKDLTIDDPQAQTQADDMRALIESLRKEQIESLQG